MSIAKPSHLARFDLAAVICLMLMFAGVFALMAAYAPRDVKSESQDRAFEPPWHQLSMNGS